MPADGSFIAILSYVSLLLLILALFCFYVFISCRFLVRKRHAIKDAIVARRRSLIVVSVTGAAVLALFFALRLYHDRAVLQEVAVAEAEIQRQIDPGITPSAAYEWLKVNGYDIKNWQSDKDKGWLLGEYEDAVRRRYKLVLGVKPLCRDGVFFASQWMYVSFYFTLNNRFDEVVAERSFDRPMGPYFRYSVPSDH